MQDEAIIVIGLGQTGQSVARYFHANKIAFQVCDSRSTPPQLADFKQQFPKVNVYCGDLDPQRLCKATQLVVSPGVSIHTPAIQAAKRAGVEVIGDIELFVRQCSKPIVAITGSNGKTTVTSLVGSMARVAGRNVAVGGNIGQPALDLLSSVFDLCVLELSSFQLETTPSLQAAVAVNLNVSEDHLDRYASYQEYIAAKLHIYQHAAIKVINLDDPAAWQNVDLTNPTYGFSLNEAYPQSDSMHIITPKDLQGLDITQYYQHQILNMLAAWCLGTAINLPESSMLEAIQHFSELPHRCQLVVSYQGVDWINDSKATNVGSALSALSSIGERIDHKIILIAGGEGKGADFSPLTSSLTKFCKAVVLLGKDKLLLAAIVPPEIETIFVTSLHEAVSIAQQLAVAGDAVLLSPACASTDMFKNYIERGEQFAHIVMGIIDDQQNNPR